MFEFSIAKKYLIPRSKQLSVSLIALMSVLVISLVVWLLLVFLSVMQGIERSWLEKLTALNAHIRITPTEAYYHSYYYQIDEISSFSRFTTKTIGEKYKSLKTDPYSSEEDQEIPAYFPKPDLKSDGSLKDPVKLAFQILEKISQKKPGITYQDFELSGAMLRLQLVRPESFSSSLHLNEHQSYLTQVSYVASFPDKNPYLPSLLLPPTAEDLNHLFYLAFKDDKQNLPSFLNALNDHVELQEIETSASLWSLPFTDVPNNITFRAWLPKEESARKTLFLPLIKEETQKLIPSFPASEKIEGEVVKQHGKLLFRSLDKSLFLTLDEQISVFVVGKGRFSGSFVGQTLLKASQLKDIHFNLHFSLQDHSLNTVMPWENLKITKIKTKTTLKQHPSSLLAQRQGHAAVVLAKSFQDNGVRIGDKGYLSYMASNASSMQEQRLPIYVAGFYDPGFMAIGNKCILAPPPLLRALNTSNFFYSFDRTLSNGIQIWCQNINDVETIKNEIQIAFQEANIQHYWKTTSFREYDFAKDLLQQFQSDKYLFTLIGVIILLVACCNIISFLVLLVNDKKKEIAILQAMGASSKSIACIFASCGALVGMISSGIGIVAASLTLHFLDKIISLLSFIQGHDLFNAMFYGKSMPNALSGEALLFVLIATPLLSLCAGLIPAIKACRLKPSTILRAE